MVGTPSKCFAKMKRKVLKAYKQVRTESGRIGELSYSGLKLKSQNFSLNKRWDDWEQGIEMIALRCFIALLFYYCCESLILLTHMGKEINV